MPCDTSARIVNGLKQSLKERAEEVRSAVDDLDRALKHKRVKPVVGPQGAITFVGVTEQPSTVTAGITDACAYRRIMATGSALAKAEIARAEQLAGRTVNRQALVQGIHSHDGGRSWHNKG